ncbi:Nucleosomal histone H3-Lys79 methylase [Paramarasmius palmivorus]|uniref:Histone-lysine N-methyltransferase, H3 lysine-79 specific n=1 Tax=Paramarasmius palmivorus TaxID=297713 RepID=A0AAW0BHH7_9AGAR
MALEDKLSLALDNLDRALLIKAVGEVNVVLRDLEPRHFGPALNDFIVQQSYDRCIRPHHSLVQQYRSFSSETYGETMPKFIEQLLNHCPITDKSLVVDLGCGVGNVVSQIGIATRCSVYGIEIRQEVAALANQLVAETDRRSRLWGLESGTMTVLHGDILTHTGLREVLKSADLIFCNNFCFDEKSRPFSLDLD